MKLSKSEKTYIIGGIEENMRLDGRKRLGYRSFFIETGIVSNANGSARVKLSNTDVLCGVKLELGKPSSKEPGKGILIINFECSPGDLPEDVVTNELQSTFREILINSMDLEKLCIVRGSFCWIIYIDCLVIQSSGNIHDAVGICIKSALYNTKIPGVEIVDLEDDKGKELIVTSDSTKVIPFDTSSIPIPITFAVFDKRYVVDPTIEEESCMNTALTMTYNKEKVFSIHKRGFYGVNPKFLSIICKSALKIGKELSEKLEKVLDSEKDLQNKDSFLNN